MKEVTLYNSIDVAIVDDEDFAEVSNYRWFKDDAGYARSYIYCRLEKKPIVVAMSRLIMRTPPTLTVDHINRIKLDNRRENLRNCTQQQNCINRLKAPEFRSSRYKGVSYYKKTGKWVASLYQTLNGEYRQYKLGYFDTEREAAIAYNIRAKELFGEYALLNNV